MILICYYGNTAAGSDRTHDRYSRTSTIAYWPSTRKARQRPRENDQVAGMMAGDVTIYELIRVSRADMVESDRQALRGICLAAYMGG